MVRRRSSVLPTAAFATAAVLVAVGCYDYDLPNEGARTDDIAAPVSSKIVGDWALFPDGSAVAAVQRFFHDRFEAKVPTPGGTTEGVCEAGMPCQLWLHDVPSGNQWQQVKLAEGRVPATYDLIVFKPEENVKSLVAVVDHVENGTIYVMSSDANDDMRRSRLPHGWRAKAYGWFHLKKLDTDERRPPTTSGSPSGASSSSGGTTSSSSGGTPSDDAGTDAAAPAPGPAPTTGCVPNAYYCGGHKLQGEANQLYRCNADGAPILMSRCANGCAVNADGQDDACNAPTPCVVGGDYCGGDKVNGEPDVLYRCVSPDGPPTVITRCFRGCSVMPPGNDDRCAP